MKKFEDEEEAYFHIDQNELYCLFDPDNIRDLISISRLKGLNGHIGLQKALKTDLKIGLSDREVLDMKYRKEYFGSNDPFEPEPATLFDMVMECFEDTMLQILVVATIVSTTIGIVNEGIQTGWMEGASILVAIIIIVSVGAGNNYVKEKQFQKLNEKKEEIYMEVIRDGDIKQIHVKNLLVGDIISVQIGNIIPVDGILIEGSEIQMDESQITGESDYISKLPITKLDSREDSCFLISGSNVMDGQGKMLCLAVGENTQLGKLRAKLNEESPPTPLQTKLESIAEDIGTIGTVAAALTMIALWINLGIQIYLNQHCALCVETLQELLNAFMIAVTIIVVAVPEGLPLAVTISLAFSVNQMKDENNLVKQLASCEIMGGCTDICSDKTGTLTTNSMSVQKMFIEDQIFEEKSLERHSISQDTLQVLCEGICINSSANPKKVLGEWQQIGNKTECALIQVASKLGLDYKPYRLNTERVLKIIPFSSSRKKMTSIYLRDNNTIRVYIKGASEAILSICSQRISKQGFQQLTTQDKEKIHSSVIEVLSDQALRTIGLAYKDIPIQNPKQVDQLKDSFFETDLILIGIAGIKDPLRKEIPMAINQCKNAGIMPRMVTGDNVNTAVAIAKEAGILPSDFGKYVGNTRSYEVMEGKNFREIVGGLVYENPKGETKEQKGKQMVKDMQMFKQIARELKVLARSTPEDKYILVTGLIQLQKVVAVTGDGTNDAPALKKADVGFAMGIAGTDVAKQAAGIILLDDNFASIVTACKWGRNIYDSIRKFIQFQLTVNIVALFMSFMGSVILKQSPLNSIEMLWVNIIMDTFASLALSTDPPSQELLNRKPYGRNDHIVNGLMWRNVIGQSIYQIVCLTLILFMSPNWLGIESSIGMTQYTPEKAVHFTVFFQAFVLMQIFNEFNARKIQPGEINIFSGFFKNKLFWLVIIVSIAVQYSMVEYGGVYVSVSKLTINQHLFCAAFGVGGIPFGMLIKILPTSWFEGISIFNEDEIEEDQMDQTLTSKLRRKSTIRIGHASINEKRQSLMKSQSIKNIQGVSLHSG